VVKSSTVAITVGTAAPSAPAAPTQTTSIVGMMTANWMYLAIAASAVIVGYLYLGDKPKRR